MTLKTHTNCPLLFCLNVLLFMSGVCAEELPVIAVQFTTQPPAIDGALEDSCWRNAFVINELQPRINGKNQEQVGSHPTQIRLLRDADNLYLSFTCMDDDIYTTGSIPHDGNIYTEDACEFFLDAMGDGRQWFEIEVNPFNQTLDMIYLFTGKPTDVTQTGRLTPEAASRDCWRFREWETEGLRTATGRIVEDKKVIGWTVEMAIPAKNITKRLGGENLKPGSLRANFVRYDYPKSANGKRETLFMSWALVEFGCPHISPMAMGKLILEPPCVTSTTGHQQKP